MSSAIEILVKQALKTFERSRGTFNALCFEDNFAKLRQLTDKITAEDVNLSKSIASNPNSRAPITYVAIFEDLDVTIGIFILKSGSSLPLHDHPNMHGILKVLAGTVKIQSYSKVEMTDSIRSKIFKSFSGDKKLIACRKHAVNTFSFKDVSSHLNEIDGNIHEISHVNGKFAAFLDILAPPYCIGSSNDNDRDCHYFNEDFTIYDQGLPLSVLKQMPSSPAHYWSDTAKYYGPSITNEK